MKRLRIGALLLFTMMMMIFVVQSAVAAESSALTTVISYAPAAMLSITGAIMALIFLDALMGIASAIKNKTFNIRKLPQFVSTNLLPYVGGLIVLMLAAILVPDLSAAFYTAAAAVAAKYLAEIKDKIAAVFGEEVADPTDSTVIDDITFLDELRSMFSGVATEIKVAIEKLVPGDNNAAAATTASKIETATDAITAIENALSFLHNISSAATPAAAETSADTANIAAADANSQTN